MTGDRDILLRLIVAAEVVAMVSVRAYYSFLRRGGTFQALLRGPEGISLTMTLAILALLHLGAVLAYIVWPSVLVWSGVALAEPIRWAGIVASCAGAGGEVWAAISLGAGYSPLLRVAKEQVLITAGAYRWIRHPLYAFGLPLMVGWGIAAANWFITATGILVILLAMFVRAPFEEAMMLGAFGERYREYMDRTGRFAPRLWSVHGK
jgi:protein-S-isoprenylcysteine O-methyltransferase Ste14